MFSDASEIISKIQSRLESDRSYSTKKYSLAAKTEFRRSKKTATVVTNLTPEGFYVYVYNSDSLELDFRSPDYTITDQNNTEEEMVEETVSIINDLLS